MILDWKLAALTLIFTVSPILSCNSAVTDDSGDNKNNAIRLSENSFKDGNVEKNGEQWFRFTAASAGTYYIHVIFGTLEYMNVRVFNTAGSPVGGEVNLRERMSNWSFSRELHEGVTYHIRVRPYYPSDSGTYRIGYNKTITAPMY
ncbi:MAG: hypothetical protein LBH35_06920 [Treponema sp.]|jgi:hypothetical protein|nr:hypothetical protein [Treponema sp.]